MLKTISICSIIIIVTIINCGDTFRQIDYILTNVYFIIWWKCLPSNVTLNGWRNVKLRIICIIENFGVVINSICVYIACLLGYDYMLITCTFTFLLPLFNGGSRLEISFCRIEYLKCMQIYIGHHIAINRNILLINSK